jgi:integrase
MAAKRIKKRGVRMVPITPELADALETQRKAFVEKFGREPEGDEPIFFDPNEETPQPYSHERMAENHKAIVEAMERAGIDPAKIYAFKKTGFMPSEEGWKNMSPADKAEYKAAILRYKEEGDPEMDDSELRTDLLTLLD